MSPPCSLFGSPVRARRRRPRARSPRSSASSSSRRKIIAPPPVRDRRPSPDGSPRLPRWTGCSVLAPVGDRLRVHPGLLPAVDRGEHHAGAVVVEHRARERQPPAHVLERVVPQQRDAAHAASICTCWRLSVALSARTACSSRSMRWAWPVSTPRSASLIWIGPAGSLARRDPEPDDREHDREHRQPDRDEGDECERAVGQGHGGLANGRRTVHAACRGPRGLTIRPPRARACAAATARRACGTTTVDTVSSTTT